MDDEKKYGNYDAPWTKTFDLVFLILWIIALIVLSVFTYFTNAAGSIDREFFAFSLTKIIIVGAISLLGGLFCRKFCSTDEKGYIIYSRPTKFKVNYTRKLQHFAAYLAPLINPFGKHEGLIPHLWETLFVMLTFLLLIKPLRENCRFFMLQFNSMDRPEDRPHTLKWIILGNLGRCVICFHKFPGIRNCFWEDITASQFSRNQQAFSFCRTAKTGSAFRFGRP